MKSGYIYILTWHTVILVGYKLLMKTLACLAINYHMCMFGRKHIKVVPK